jgi:hypothetical protein
VDTAGHTPTPLQFAAAVRVETVQLAGRQVVVVSGKLQSG